MCPGPDASANNMLRGRCTLPSSTTFGLTEYLPGLLMAAGVSLLTLLLLMNLRFKLHRRAASRHISPAFAAGAAGGTGGFAAGEHLHPHSGRPSRSHQPTTIDDPGAVATHESVRLLMATLDTRCRTLEVLLRQADDRIRQLEDALDDRVGASIGPPRAAVRQRPRRASVEARHPVSSSPALGGDEPPSEPPSVEAASFGAAYFGDNLDPLTANVYELADRGRTPLEIARNLDEQVGKVELILALRGDR